MNLFIKDNTALRKEFFEFLKLENRPKTLKDCESQLLEMLNQYRAEIPRAAFAHSITILIAANNIDRAIKIFNIGIPNREPRTWFVYTYRYRYILAIIAVVATIALLN